MTPLAQQLMNRLDAASPGATLAVADGGDRLTLGLGQADRLAVSFAELRLVTDRLAGATADRVREVAQRLTERVHYLLEPLTPVEIDHELAVVQLRSVDPPQDAEGTCYYELLVKTGGAVSLRRYRKPRGSIREGVDALVTREVLGRLVEDFLVSLDS